MRLFFDYDIKMLIVGGFKPNPGLIIFLLLFLLIGLGIIFSAFFKPCFYVLLAVPVAFSIYIFCSLFWAFSLGSLIILFLVLAPPVFYFKAKK